jgi:hypothetical protein
MKIFFSLLLTLGLATTALAQGKVRFVNDSLHLVYWAPGWGGTNAGQAYLLGEGGQTLTIELWAGTSSTALSRVAVTDFNGQGGPGTWAGMNVTLPSPNFPAGLTFFEINIHPLGDPYRIFGTSGLFTASASGVTAYFSLVQHNSPGNSTWADGTYSLDSISPGFRGAIMLEPGPEPSTLGLGCLGLAMLLLRRRAERTKIQK